MKQIKIADKTLCRDDRTFSFKERLDIIRQLEKLKSDIIELPETANARTGILLVRTAFSVKNSIISVAAGSTEQSIDEAAGKIQKYKMRENAIEKLGFKKAENNG